MDDELRDGTITMSETPVYSESRTVRLVLWKQRDAFLYDHGLLLVGFVGRVYGRKCAPGRPKTRSVLFEYTRILYSSARGPSGYRRFDFEQSYIRGTFRRSRGIKRRTINGGTKNNGPGTIFGFATERFS